MTITIQQNTLAQRQWQQALALVDFYAYQQDWAYGEAARAMGAAPLRLAIYEADTLVALAQCHTRKILRGLSLLTCLRGPVFLPEVNTEQRLNIWRALKRYPFASAPCLRLWMPESEDAALLHQAGLRQMITPYHTAYLALHEDDAALLAAMDGKWRNRLRKSQAAGLHIRTEANQPEILGWLIEKEVAQATRIGYRALHPSFIRHYHQGCETTNLFIFTASQKGERVAAMVFLAHGKNATYHIGWANALGKQHNAHNLLLWNAMRGLRDKGIATLDMGGLNSRDGAGIMRFKLGCGAQLSALPGSYT